MDILEKAIALALKAHEGQKRKCGSGPYILHPLEVVIIASTLTDDSEVLAAAVLHDTVEDTKVTMDDIKKEFGLKVAQLVASETEDKLRGENPSETWHFRKEESLKVLRATKDINVKIIWLADKLANIRSLYREYNKFGDLIWEKFNQKDPQEHYWYYLSISKALLNLEGTLAYKEFNELIKKVFE